MSHPFDILALENGSQLIFTPCPGTKDSILVESISTLKQAGTNMLITLMFDEEMEKNNAAPSQAFESQWDAQKANILEVINNKGTIAVHCKGGSGRTGLVIGLILLAFGWSGEKVIEAVQEIRPKALKHPVQLDYFNTYL